MAELSLAQQFAGEFGFAASLNTVQFAHLRRQHGLHFVATPTCTAPDHAAAMMRLPSLTFGAAAAAPDHTSTVYHNSQRSLDAMRASVLQAARKATEAEVLANQAGRKHSTSLVQQPSSDAVHSADQLQLSPQDLAEWAAFPVACRSPAIHSLPEGGWLARPGGRATSLLSALIRRDHTRFNKRAVVTPRPSTARESVVLQMPALQQLFVERVSANTYKWVGPSPTQLEQAALMLKQSCGPTLGNIGACVQRARTIAEADAKQVKEAARQAAVQAAVRAYSSQRAIAVTGVQQSLPSSAIALPSSAVPVQGFAAAPAAAAAATSAAAAAPSSSVEYEENPDLAIDSIASLLG